MSCEPDRGACDRRHALALAVERALPLLQRLRPGLTRAELQRALEALVDSGPSSLPGTIGVWAAASGEPFPVGGGR